MHGQHPQSYEVVRLAAAHCLREFKDGLIGLFLQPTERFREQDPHALRHEVLLKEILGVDFVRSEMAQGEDSVAPGDVEDAIARDEEFFE